MGPVMSSAVCCLDVVRRIAQPNLFLFSATRRRLNEKRNALFFQTFCCFRVLRCAVALKRHRSTWAPMKRLRSSVSSARMRIQQQLTLVRQTAVPSSSLSSFVLPEIHCAKRHGGPGGVSQYGCVEGMYTNTDEPLGLFCFFFSF